MDNIADITKKSILQAQMKGERLITIIRLFLIIILFLFFVFIFFNALSRDGLLKTIKSPAYYVEFLGIILTLIYSFWILKKLKKSIYFKYFKYISPFIEITLLNFIIYTNASFPRTALIMTGAPTFLYLIFLVLTTLRNSFSSVIFTGLYITISYGCLSFNGLSVLKIFQENGNVFSSIYSKIIVLDWDDEVIKVIIFGIITVLLAYMSLRFNKMVSDQIAMSIEREKLKEVLVGNVKQVSETLLSSGKELSNTYSEFSGRINEMVVSSRKIGDETSQEYVIVESTSKTVTDIIQSIEIVTKNIKEQSFLVGETVAAIGQMENSIRTITSTSQNANKIAQNLFNAAKDGSNAVNEVYNAIIETEKSSIQIEEIVKLITNISLTTNILSMNASIEAAHAGEAGKGFAVVADEIRKLAEASSASAKQIGEILKDILSRIKNIMLLAKQANSKLQSILNDADQTKEVNSIIQNAMEEELLTINEILKSQTSLENLSVELKDSSTHQSEENTGLLSSISELKTQADNVSRLIKDLIGECETINNLTNTFNSIVKNNDSAINQLESLVTKM